MSRFRALGVKLSPTSRLLAAISRIDRSRSRPTIDIVQDADFAARLVEAHRTVLEFYVISTALDSIPGAWRHRVSIAIGGMELPAEDRRSEPRDAQFELLVVALVHHAGFLDVEVGEPDVRIKAGDKWLAIAAKRITSQSQLRKRLRHASKQIQRQYESGVEFGIIALNVDIAITSVSHTLGIEKARIEFDSLVKAAEDLVQGHALAERVPAIQAFATLFYWRPTSPAMTLGVEFLSHSRWTSPASERSQIEQFLRARARHLERTLERLLQRL